MTETLNKTRFLIDFGGFYYSIHSDILDIQIDYFEIDEDNVNYTYKCLQILVMKKLKLKA